MIRLSRGQLFKSEFWIGIISTLAYIKKPEVSKSAPIVVKKTSIYSS